MHDDDLLPPMAVAVHVCDDHMHMWSVIEADALIRADYGLPPLQAVCEPWRVSLN